MSGTAPEGVLSMEEMARLNEMREVVTQGQNLSPEDKESLIRVTDELSHVGKVAERPDEQTLYVPNQKSKGEEGSEHLQLQLHQYSDSLKGISDRGSTSGAAPEGGVLSMEELVVTEGQDLFPQDEESLTKLTEDLSGTSMYTLPQHIFRLVTLQKLLLRNCEILMMELPPEIGELKNLEVLDLEGTEILCLPMEIAKLVNLTCLKVSFYGYANQTVIPKTVLSNLSRLKELIIDVTPYGEWWDVEVKAIIDDLRSLKELTTLKLYLPTAELLEDLTLIFPDLANFRFTVGRQEEHFISRLPQDVEEEFNNQEKLEKGLKFINGNCIPNEITKVLKHANAFFLQCHWIAESLSEFGHENLNEVKFLLVMDCNEFRTIIDFEKLYQRKDGSAEFEVFQDFNEATVLGSLERLIIRYMKNMESIWKGSVANGSLSNLKSLALHTCPKLTTLFTINMLSNLINLEELIVEDCTKINSLVSLQNSSSKSMRFLPSLKKISLLYLPRLVSISSGLGIAPKLERMVVFYCPQLEKLSATEVSSTGLKVIKGEKEWWDALKWYESDLSTEDEDHLDCLFIPLRRDGDLMAQLTEDEFGGYGQGEVGSSKIPDPPSVEISSEESEEISSEELEETPSNPREILDPPSKEISSEELEEISLEESEETPSNPREILGSVKDTISVAQSLRSSMASLSNSEFEVIYDIFLSFRGLDTGHRLIDHLYKALKQEGFKMFEDDEIPIKSELGKAIMNSRMSVIVLSKNYTNSTMCLFELQKILERRKMSDHFVLPVFYEVDPLEIKEQARNLDFGEKKVTVDEVKGWSAALNEVAGMAGFVFQNQSSRYDAKFIEEIVGEVKSKLTGERMRVADHKASADEDFFREYDEGRRYRIEEVIGKGSHGVVCSAYDTQLWEKVAIKKISDVFRHVSDATRILCEIKLLRLLCHDDIVKIKHILLPPSRGDFKDIYIVLELTECDLQSYIKANDGLTPGHCRHFLYQLLRGLKYIHTANVFHRDLNPKNVLTIADSKIKIRHFSHAFVDTPTAMFWTDYVATRWYKAPELCGQFFSKYSAAIDIWSIGCIFAELLTGKPLFPGENHVHQLDLITDLLGTPSPEFIAKIKNEKAHTSLSSMGRKRPIPFPQKFPNADPLALVLLKKMLAFDPDCRPSAEEALADPYFKELARIESEPSAQPVTEAEFAFEGLTVTKEDLRELIYREILQYHPKLLKKEHIDIPDPNALHSFSRRRRMLAKVASIAPMKLLQPHPS